jgi:hypothetical protein
MQTALQSCGARHLIGALEASYPFLQTRMGAGAFRHAAAWHIDMHTPLAWTLDVYTEDFGQTLRALYPDEPELHELAWIEHALASASGSCRAPRAMPGLLLTPTLRTLRASTNAADIWQALEAGACPPEARTLDQPMGLLVWQRGRDVSLRCVETLEYLAVLHMQANGSFNSLCAMLSRRVGGAGTMQAGALLADWMRAGLLAHSDLSS